VEVDADDGDVNMDVDDDDNDDDNVDGDDDGNDDDDVYVDVDDNVDGDGNGGVDADGGVDGDVDVDTDVDGVDMGVESRTYPHSPQVSAPLGLTIPHFGQNTGIYFSFQVVWASRYLGYQSLSLPTA
jgi:hypothetical protein